MVDVVVIGAGISGLSSATLLAKFGLNVVVLEAQERVGGRTFTRQDASFGGYTDLGGAYVGPTYWRVQRLARQFNLEFEKPLGEAATLINFHGKWMSYGDAVSVKSNPMVAMDVENLLHVVYTMAQTVPADAPWMADNAKEWDRMTVKEFVDKTCWTDLARSLAGIACRAMLCAEMHEVSVLAFLWHIAAGPVLQNKAGVPEQKFVRGAQQLCERMAAALGKQVQLSSPVTRVEQLDDCVNVSTANGLVYQAKYVICAIPLALLNRVTFIPSLPALKLQLIQRFPMGSVIKTMTYYERAYWKEKNMSGRMLIDDGPVLYCADDTKADGSAPCIVGLVVADQARAIGNMTPDERKQTIAAHYAEKFGIPELNSPVNYIEMNWNEDEYSGGGYLGNFYPGVLTQFGAEIRRPYLKTFFAGTETATYWSGYMEGAVDAGERAAREVLHADGKISASEIWRDEPDDPGLLPDKPVPPKRRLPSVSQSLVVVGALCAVFMTYSAVKLRFPRH